jgi:hypothetical protein
MVLIGPIIIALIIIAVVLMALLVLGVSGIRWKPPARNAQPQGRTWERPDSGVVTS